MAIGKSGYLDVTCMPQSVGVIRVYWREDYYNDGNYSTITVTDIQGYLWHRADWAYIAVKVIVDNMTIMNSNEWMISCQADTSFRSAVPRTQWDGKFTPVTSAPIYHNEDGQKTITLTFTLVDIWCGDYDGSDNQSVSATIELTKTHTHSYSSVVTAPSCTSQGYTTHTCSCGSSYVDTYISALGHSWDNGIVTIEPTYTTDGAMTYTCSRCSTTKIDLIQRLGASKRFVPVVFIAGEEYIPYVYTSSAWCTYCPNIHDGTIFESY